MFLRSNIWEGVEIMIVIQYTMLYAHRSPADIATIKLISQSVGCVLTAIGHSFLLVLSISLLS